MQELSDCVTHVQKKESWRKLKRLCSLLAQFWSGFWVLFGNFTYDFFIWAKFSLIIIGLAAIAMFIRLNFPVGEPLKLDTAVTPILLMPNAILTNPTPLPRTK